MSEREIIDAKRGIVARKSYGFRDEVVKNVVDKFVERSDVGYAKYGQTLHDERTSGVKDLAAYLNDIQEELEKYMYLALKKAKIKAKYEGKTYIIQEGFEFDNQSYERQSNGKGEFKNRGNKKILPIKYTPDFVSSSFIIECKGRANESFPMRWKLFKNYVKVNLPRVTLYKPQNQKECDTVIELITKNKIK